MIRIGSKNSDQINDLAERALSELKGMTGFDQSDTGGHLCIADKYTGVPILILKIGECLPKNSFKYIKFAVEKAKRLAYWAKKKGHVSSHQSANERAKRYGGAVVAGDYIVSFSGLLANADEALSINVARRCDLEVPAAEIVAHSHNEFYSVV